MAGSRLNGATYHNGLVRRGIMNVASTIGQQ